MADIEKVIKALEKCTEKHGECDGCPYLGTGVWCKIQIDKDALKLLKELKAEKERNPVIVCPHCGRRVK